MYFPDLAPELKRALDAELNPESHHQEVPERNLLAGLWPGGQLGLILGVRVGVKGVQQAHYSMQKGQVAQLMLPREHCCVCS